MNFKFRGSFGPPPSKHDSTVFVKRISQVVTDHSTNNSLVMSACLPNVSLWDAVVGSVEGIVVWKVDVSADGGFSLCMLVMICFFVCCRELTN